MFFEQADGSRQGEFRRDASLRMDELPARLQERDWPVLELVHFQIEDVSDAGLAALRKSIADAGITLATVLIDAGDIAHPDPQQRAQDIQLIELWIRRAAALGAQAVRVQVGDQDPHAEGVVERSIAGLNYLAGYAAALGVHCRTENFRRTGDDAEVLERILQGCDGRVSCCIDFGNAESFADKYAGLDRLMPFASAVHLKARYTDAKPDEQDLRSCLSLVEKHGYQQHISLIHGEHPDEWEDLDGLAALTRLILGE